MKAIKLKTYKGTNSLILTKSATLKLASGQILVSVKASSINPFDKALISGIYKDLIILKTPFTPGGDFSGIVRETLGNSSKLKNGDQVFGTASILSGGSGAFAEEALVSTETVSLKPKKSNFEESASLVLVGVSAYQALVENIKLKRGQKILIHGGAGGIGHVAIQLAKAMGAHVATTVSREDSGFVKKLGATGVIDYKKQEFEKLLKGYDAVFDTVGGVTTTKSFLVLKKGGVLVSMKGQPEEILAKKYGIIGIAQNTKVTSERLKKLSTFVESGKIKVHLEKIFKLEDIRVAFNYLENEKVKGKIAIKV